MQILKEFRQFLDEYKIVGLAVAFIIGAALTNMVQALVNSILMPIIAPFIPGGAWQAATFNIGPVAIGWGIFLSAVLNFVIIALVVFLIAKYLLKESKVTKK